MTMAMSASAVLPSWRAARRARFAAVWLRRRAPPAGPPGDVERSRAQPEEGHDEQKLEPQLYDGGIGFRTERDQPGDESGYQEGERRGETLEPMKSETGPPTQAVGQPSRCGEGDCGDEEQAGHCQEPFP